MSTSEEFVFPTLETNAYHPLQSITVSADLFKVLKRH